MSEICILTNQQITRRDFGRRIVGGFLVATGLATITPQSAKEAEATDSCSNPVTDGRPAPFCTVPFGADLRARSRFSRFYYIDQDGTPRYSLMDRDVMGVPDALLVIEALEPINSSDFLKLDLHSRRVEDGRVSYLDTKSAQRRFVGRWDVMRVPHDGGTGLALSTDGSDTLEWRLNPGGVADKIWGPILTQEKIERSGHKCNDTTHCGWNCVQWIVVNRLKAGANVNGLSVIPSNLIHVEIDANKQPVIDPTTGKTKISSLVDYVYYWDLSKDEKIRRDHNYINTPVTEGDPLWVKEGLSFKNVDRPSIIVPYNNN